MADNNTARVMQPSSFEFLTFSDVSAMRDTAAKSVIRKHAMRDIGVSRRRPDKRRKGYVKIPLKLLTPPNEVLTPPNEVMVPNPTRLNMGSGAIDPFIAFPVELDHVGRELVANSGSLHMGSTMQRECS